MMADQYGIQAKDRNFTREAIGTSIHAWSTGQRTQKGSCAGQNQLTVLAHRDILGIPMYTRYIQNDRQRAEPSIFSCLLLPLQ